MLFKIIMRVAKQEIIAFKKDPSTIGYLLFFETKIKIKIFSRIKSQI